MQTGKILDNQVHPKICDVCRYYEEKHKDKTDDEYKIWYKGHQPVCNKTTELSSNAMEAQGAKEMWGRSISKNKMRYTTFVGDGDSKAFKTVCDLQPYGEEIEIIKADCIGHVQKRMGNRLREWKRKAPEKMEDSKSPREKGRLTDDVIDKLQNYYGMAIRSNIPDVNAMSIATKAILHHSVLPFTPSERRPYPKKLMDKKPVKERISEKDWEK